MLWNYFPKGISSLLWEQEVGTRGFLTDLILMQYQLCFEYQRKRIFQWTKFNLIFRYEEQQMDRYQMAKLEHHRVYPSLDGTLDKLTLSPVSLLGRQWATIRHWLLTGSIVFSIDLLRIIIRLIWNIMTGGYLYLFW